MKIVHQIAALVMPLLLLVSCSRVPEDAVALPYEADPKLQVSGQLKSDAFALVLFREILREQPGNVVFSPAGVENLLRLVRQGARGQSAEALDALPMGQPGVASAMQTVESTALFTSEQFRLKPGIHADTVISVPMTSAPKQAAKRINGWANAHTRGLIPDIVTPEQLMHGTRMVAANAIALEEKWLRPFDPEQTQTNYSFTCADGSTAKVPMMFEQNDFRYAQGEDWQAVALFYRTDGRKGQPGCFLAILPRDGKARDFVASLTTEKFSTIRHALASAEPHNMWVGLPRFELRTESFSLNNALKAAGLSQLFSTQADLSGFSDEPLFLESVLQRCYVKADEQGVKASAVTVASFKCYSPNALPDSITFNRPFIWAITDLTSAAPPYFVGLFEKP